MEININETLKISYPVNIFGPENVCLLSLHALQNTSIMAANSVNPDQTAPIRSSQICVHTNCNIGYQSIFADEIADFFHSSFDMFFFFLGGGGGGWRGGRKNIKVERMDY